MKKENFANKQLIDIIEKYLLSQNLFVNQNLLKKYFASVPSFPSIFALIQTLKQFGIVLSVVSSDWDTLVQCDKKVLLYLKKEMDMWVILENCSDNEIVYQDGNSTIFREKKELFLNHWNGLLLYVENIDKEVQSSLRDAYKKANIKKHLLFISLLIIISYLISKGLLSENLNIWFAFCLCLKTIGGIASYFLLRHSLGLTSNFENKVCFISKMTDCKAVLHSPASKIFNKISMSDVGVIYFSGSLLLLLASVYISNIWPFLIMLSFCSIPYCLFSIGYQFFVVNKICPFCLVVVIVLLLENVLNYCVFSTMISKYNWISLGAILPIFILLYIALNYIKEAYNTNVYFQNIEFEYLRFKRNETVYISLLQQEISLKYTDVEAIVVGDSNIPTVITVILGLYCNLCAETFKRIEQLLINSYSDFQFHIHFVSNEVEDKVFFHLYSIYKKKNIAAFLDALRDWYTSRDYEKIKRIYPLKEIITRECVSIYKKQHYLLEKSNKINRTPTIYVNEKLLPSLYKIDDLIYFV